MLKRVLCVGTVMAIFASTAMATAWIKNISEAEPTGNSYLVGGLSADGRYVGISRYIEWGSNLTPYDGPALYDTTTDAYLPLSLKSGHGAVRGVEALADGTPISLVVEVSNQNSASWRKGVYGGAIDQSGYMDGGANSMPGNQNAMAMDANGNGWMVGRALGAKFARAWQITGGNVNATAVYNTVKYSDNWEVLNGVSVGGMAVGTFSPNRAFLTRVDPASPGNRALTFGQISSSNTSQGNAISSNGMWAGGYVNVDDANSLNGWRLEISPTFPSEDGTYTRLLPVGYDPLVAQQSNVFDIADDGTAVGFSYDPIDGYNATLWAAGSDQGVLVWDILYDLGVDLSGWESLERVVSISDDGLTIAGRGVLVGGADGAFVAMIPEPASLAFLALGSLALLRRRR